MIFRQRGSRQQRAADEAGAGLQEGAARHARTRIRLNDFAVHDLLSSQSFFAAHEVPGRITEIGGRDTHEVPTTFFQSCCLEIPFAPGMSISLSSKKVVSSNKSGGYALLPYRLTIYIDFML